MFRKKTIWLKGIDEALDRLMKRKWSVKREYITLKELKKRTKYMEKVYFSSTETIKAWTGGGYYKLLRKLNIGRFMICIWRKGTK